MKAKNTLTSNTSQEDIEKAKRQSDIQIDVVRSCGHLVKFSANRLILVHRSLKTFLTTSIKDLEGVKYHKNYFFEEKYSHGVISDLCIAYLLQPSFEHSGTRFDLKDPEWETIMCGRLKKHSFVAYAALSWITHTRLSGKLFEHTFVAYAASILVTHTWAPPFPANVKLLDQYHPVLSDPQKQHAICWIEVWWYRRRFRSLWRKQGVEVGLEDALDSIIEEEIKPNSTAVELGKHHLALRSPQVTSIIVFALAAIIIGYRRMR